MTEPELIPDDQWDNYSQLPNPMWDQKQKENGEQTQDVA